MIYVDKGFDDVPNSLNSDLTKQRRDEVIAAKCYPNQTTISAFQVSVSTYNSRYKQTDVKESLDKIYYSKCAYCEQRVEAWEVEHYRPKSIYYWLVYSWDNLLSCCSTCNKRKLANFKVVKRVGIDDFDIADIHNLGEEYDEYESPEFINPEKENIQQDLVYDQTGKPSSKNFRVQFTITQCKLDRKTLNDLRRRIYDILIEDIALLLKTIGDSQSSKECKEEAKKELGVHIAKFVKESARPANEFLSFRKYVIKHRLPNIYKNLS